MADFLLLVVAALVVAGIVFGVVSFALGRESGLSEPEPDGVAEPLPDHPLSADDLDQARFDVVLRGYRMDQVDALVNRVSSDVRQLQEYVDSLEGQLAAARGGPVAPQPASTDAGAAEDEARGWRAAEDEAGGWRAAEDEAAGRLAAGGGADGGLSAEPADRAESLADRAESLADRAESLADRADAQADPAEPPRDRVDPRANGADPSTDGASQDGRATRADEDTRADARVERG